MAEWRLTRRAHERVGADGGCVVDAPGRATAATLALEAGAELPLAVAVGGRPVKNGYRIDHEL